VRLIVFDKPYKKVDGVLHIAKISEHTTSEGAKEKAESLKSQLRNLSIPRTCLLAYLRDENFSGDPFTAMTKDMIMSLFAAGIYGKTLILHPSSASNYLKPFDVIKIQRGGYKHVGVYLGGD